MANRLSRLSAFILGPSAKAEEDEFEPDFSDHDDEEPTDVVELSSVRPLPAKPRPVPAPVTSLEQRRRPAASAARPIAMSEIMHVRPYSFAEAARIGESFKEGIPIILNLTTTDEKQAQKLIDFASGMAFVTDGKLERITPKVFIITPATVRLTEADKTQLATAEAMNE